jgi:hypothetical protein
LAIDLSFESSVIGIAMKGFSRGKKREMVLESVVLGSAVLERSG